jgi:hypothetical protein
MVRFCFRAKASSYNNNVDDLGIKDFRNNELAEGVARDSREKSQ